MSSLSKLFQLFQNPIYHLPTLLNPLAITTTLFQILFFNPISFFLKFILTFIYILVQRLIVVVFKPPLPRPGIWDGEVGLDGEGEDLKGEWAGVMPHGRVAVIGAGLTGVSSAA
jgi:hypothetical protein